MKNILLLITSFIFFLNTKAQTWQELGLGINALPMNHSIDALTSDNNSNIYVAGKNFNQGLGLTFFVAKWDGASWTVLGGTNAGTTLNANNTIHTIITDKYNNVYIGGEFTDSVSFLSGHCYVAKWDGTAWSKLGNLNANAAINALTIDSSGNIYAAGYFTDSSTSNKGHYYVAKWDGSTWSELKNFNQLNANNPINTLMTDKQGKVYAAGDFTYGTGNSTYVAEFNGSGWGKVGFNPNSYFGGGINTLALDSSGNIYAGGYLSILPPYTIAKFDGTDWKVLGAGAAHPFQANFGVNSIVIDKYQHLFAGGDFFSGSTAHPHTYVAKWDGTDWSESTNNDTIFNTNVTQGQSNSIKALCIDRQNNIYAGGGFSDTATNPFVAKLTPLVSGISNISAASNDLKVYPNPTTNQLTVSGIQFSGNTKVEIENVLGQVMVSLSNHLTTANCQLTTANLPSGIYILKATDEKGFVHTAKFVKE